MNAIRAACHQVINQVPPGIVAYTGPRAPMLTQPEGEALSEFIFMVGSHKAAIRLVQGQIVRDNQGGPVEISPDQLP